MFFSGEKSEYLPCETIRLNRAISFLIFFATDGSGCSDCRYSIPTRRCSCKRRSLFISRSGESSYLILGMLSWIQTSPAADSCQWDYGIPHNERTDLNIPFYSSLSWRRPQPCRWWIKSTVRSQMGLSQLLTQTIEHVCIVYPYCSWTWFNDTSIKCTEQRQMGPSSV